MSKVNRIFFIAVSTFILSSASRTQTLQSTFPDVNGALESFASVGTTIYIGGDFSYVAPYTGMGVALNTTTGNPINTFPIINATYGLNGQIDVIVPDGSGGFYVGGNFDRINGVTRSYLARINSDGSVNAWNPTPSYRVRSISLSADNSVVYIGGSFNQVNSTSRNGLAAIQASDGALTSWNPALSSGEVFAVSVSTNGSIYVGGDFTTSNTIGGAARNRVAEISTTTGLATAWNPNVSSSFSTVYSIAQSSGSVYIGGYFLELNGATTRFCAAKIPKGSNTVNATWNPGADFIVFSMIISGNRVYLGGSFSSAGGATSQGLVVVDTTNGTATGTWLPNTDGNVYAMALSGNTLYVGGTFNTIGGSTRNRFASIDVTSLSSVTLNSLNFGFGNEVQSIALVGTTLYVGGRFQIAGGSARNALAAINGTTGAVLSWNPNPPIGASVSSLLISADGNSAYAGGSFATIGGQTRHNLAKLSLATGNADATWNPNVDSDIGKMALSPTGDTLYFYGGFNTVNGATTRFNNAAVLTSGTGVATAFDPGGPGSTTTRLIFVSPDGNFVYIGYNAMNLTVNGTPRSYFVALNAADGTLAAMDPGFNQGAFSAVAVGTDLYIGGQFTQTTIGENTIQKIAKFDASGGWGNPQLVTTWNNTSTTRPNGDIRAILYSNTGASPMLYLGGGFSSIGSTSRKHFAAIDASDLTVQSWDVNESYGSGGLGTRMMISTATQKIYIGDDAIVSMLGTNRISLVAVSGGTDPLPVELSDLHSVISSDAVKLSWKTSSEVNNYGFEIERKSLGFAVSPFTKGSTEGFQKVGFIGGSGTTNVPKEYSFDDKKLSSGRFQYRLKQIDRDGGFKYSQSVEVELGIAPKVFGLSQNYPNPFNPSTTIKYSLVSPELVSMRVYDVLGREAALLVSERQEAGTYSVRLDASKLSSGIYYYTLKAGASISTKKMLLLK